MDLSSKFLPRLKKEKSKIFKGQYNLRFKYEISGLKKLIYSVLWIDNNIKFVFNISKVERLMTTYKKRPVIQ